MAEFEQAVLLVLAHEGGYVNDPNDPGGETNWGISKRWHPGVDIRNLTKDGAILIYQQEYWKPYMEQEPDQRMANCCLDCAVNQGQPVAQQLYGQLGHSLKGYQLARLLRYAAQNRPQNNHSWFERVLDV